MMSSKLEVSIAQAKVRVNTMLVTEESRSRFLRAHSPLRSYRWLRMTSWLERRRLSGSHASDGNHASCIAFFGAIGKKQFGIAGCAELRSRDILGGNTDRQKLAAIRFNEIKKDFLRQYTVARRARSQKKQRIFFAHRVGFLHFVKQLRGVFELRVELVPNVLANFVAAGMNAGADGSLQLVRHGAEVQSHKASALFDDALDGASPSSVKNANSFALFVCQDDGQAVGGLNAEKKILSIGNQPIAEEWLRRRLAYIVNQIGMNLAKRNQRPELVPIDCA